MKRRNFLKSTLLLSLISVSVGTTMGLLNTALANVVTFVTNGKLGYKEKAPLIQINAGKECKTCSWFKEDKSGGDDAGQCTLKAMQNSMKAKEVFVKKEAYCNMWQKQSKKS